jgi:uncharacterized protein YacL
MSDELHGVYNPFSHTSRDDGEDGRRERGRRGFDILTRPRDIIRMWNYVSMCSYTQRVAYVAPHSRTRRLARRSGGQLR